MKEKSSLLFIPDISGFTTFVKEIEITHSQHIISELLELIIDANELELTLSEIEGDAVFFYKYEEIPSSLALLRQVQKMYSSFHTHLKQYETHRICHCGACSAATRLKLKFVAHAGHFQLIKIKEHEKPFGEDVITIHNLLKNDIEEQEYLLLTQQLMQKLDPVPNTSPIEWPKLKTGQTRYKKLGTIPYQYTSLQALLQYLPHSRSIPVEPLIKDPLVFQSQIQAPTEKVFELITDFSKRLQWNKQIDQFSYDKNRVNRVGAKHICIVGKHYLEFETITNDFGANRMVYGEKTNNFPLIKEATTYFIIEKIEEVTLLRVEIHYKPRPLIGWLMNSYFKKRISKTINDSLKNIKEIAESQIRS